ncbi:hypothetical protein [Thermoleophilum album]|uniref:Uncharacterized protein n=1 Tax=Thermoleophilum album TaxID=29539 RepID=A0A1H6FIF0_THEAL|nr:hypothetical protein [Thermoleophilum album]SEH10192.1 hypothetical protein SAMN02745716_0039 [Thermoleophilum album]
MSRLAAVARALDDFLFERVTLDERATNHGRPRALRRAREAPLRAQRCAAFGELVASEQGERSYADRTTPSSRALALGVLSLRPRAGATTLARVLALVAQARRPGFGPTPVVSLASARDLPESAAADADVRPPRCDAQRGLRPALGCARTVARRLGAAGIAAVSCGRLCLLAVPQSAADRALRPQELASSLDRLRTIAPYLGVSVLVADLGRRALDDPVLGALDALVVVAGADTHPALFELMLTVSSAPTEQGAAIVAVAIRGAPTTRQRPACDAAAAVGGRAECVQLPHAPLAARLARAGLTAGALAAPANRVWSLAFETVRASRRAYCGAASPLA